MPELGQVDAIAVGLRHVCSLVDGRVACLGERTDDGSGEPINYRKPESMPDLKRAISIDASYDEICAVHVDSSIACWNYERGSALRIH